MRSFGHIPDHAQDVQRDLAERHVGRLLGGVIVSTPREMNFASWMPYIPDQKSTSSCVGQSLATSVFLRARRSGTPTTRPSPKGIYDAARLIDGPRKGLVDDGCRPLAAILGAQEFGMVTEERWPLTDENVNELPPLDVFEHGLGAILAGWYRIASGEGASLLVRQAIATGFYPIFAMPVDAAYERWSSDAIYEGRKTMSLGGHMQAICGYGDGHVKIMSSWGETHGDHGVVNISNDYIDSGECTDLLVPTVVPKSLT